MVGPPRHRSTRDLVELLLSALLSAVLLWLLAWVATWLLPKPSPAEEEEFVTEYLYEDDHEPPAPDAERDAQVDAEAPVGPQAEQTPADLASPAEAPTPAVEEETPPPDEPMVEVPPPDELRRQSVDQPSTNHEVPETDDYYLADVDNAVDEQTVAENATTVDQEEAPLDTRMTEGESTEEPQQPEPSRDDQGDAAEPTEATAETTDRDDPRDTPAHGRPEQTAQESAPEPGEGGERASSPSPPAQAATTPFDLADEGELRTEPGARSAEAFARANGLREQMSRAADGMDANGGHGGVARGGLVGARDHLDEIFGETDEEAYARGEQRRRRDSLFGDQEGDWQRTREAMENFDVAVTAGTETLLNTRRDEHAAFINAFHRRIHEQWWSVLDLLSRRYGPSENVSNRDHTVRLEIRVLADGKVDRVRIVNTSGNTFFDAEAIRVNYDVRRTAAPPHDILCGDGAVYLHWTFSRMPGRCGTQGASVHCPG